MLCDGGPLEPQPSARMIEPTALVQELAKIDMLPVRAEFKCHQINSSPALLHGTLCFHCKSIIGGRYKGQRLAERPHSWRLYTLSNEAVEVTY
ncbi:hypothetical protein M8818_001787 [Zalaria obscura]|uniref:Uncharacterized protein n=1 Tax=Zalaria obscura TaxID=2024903 RepID=A0ACC3SK15_9PEZI